MRDNLDSDEERHIQNVTQHRRTFITEQNQQVTENNRTNKIELKPKPLDLQQKLVVARIVKEVSYYHSIRKGDKVFSVEKAMEQKSIQKVIKDEFKLDNEQSQLITKAVSKQFQKIQSQGSRSELRYHSPGQIPSRAANLSSLKLSAFQRKELESFLALDYNRCPVQPCVKSLYLLARIAETLQLQVIIPPTILIGFGDDTRLLHNDSLGYLKVKKGLISPAMIESFIHTHMSSVHVQQNIEDQLTYPKFIIRSASTGNKKNDSRLYFSKDAMFQDLMNLWGSTDMAIQLFIKQKHLNRGPSIVRYHANAKGIVCKAASLTVNHQIEGGFGKYKNQIMSIVQEYKQRQIHNIITAQRKKSLTSGLNNQRNLNTRFTNAVTDKLLASIIEKNINPLKNNEIIFPKTLEYFPLREYNESLQLNFLSTDLQNQFTTTCPEDNLDLLLHISCRPTAFPLAEKMTQDLYRLFTQYYLKNPLKQSQPTTANQNELQEFKFNNFVCDFIEGENGILYLLQIKAMELNQVEGNSNWSPSNLYKARVVSNEKQAAIEVYCEAQLVCKQFPWCDDFNELMMTAFERCGIKEEKIAVHQVSSKILQKFRSELAYGEENYFLKHEKKKICPLYPLTSFQEKAKQSLSSLNIQQGENAPSSTKSQNRHSINFNEKSFSQEHSQKNERKRLSMIEESFSKPTLTIQTILQEDDHKIRTCFACKKLLDLYQCRYQTLIFKPEVVLDELKRLKLKLITHWTLDEVIYLINLYQKSQKNTSYQLAAQAHLDVETMIKKQHARELRQRSLTSQSVAEKSAGNIKSYRFMKDILSNIQISSGLQNPIQSYRSIQPTKEYRNEDMKTPSASMEKPKFSIRNSRSLKVIKVPNQELIKEKMIETDELKIRQVYLRGQTPKAAINNLKSRNQHMADIYSNFSSLNPNQLLTQRPQSSLKYQKNFSYLNQLMTNRPQNKVSYFNNLHYSSINEENLQKETGGDIINKSQQSRNRIKIFKAVKQAKKLNTDLVII